MQRERAKEAIRLIYSYDFDGAKGIIEEIRKENEILSKVLSLMLIDIEYTGNYSRLYLEREVLEIDLKREEILALEPWIALLYLLSNSCYTFSSSEILSLADDEETKALALYLANKNEGEDLDEFIISLSKLYSNDDWRSILALIYATNGLGLKLDFLNEAYERCVNTYGKDSPYLIHILEGKRLHYSLNMDYDSMEETGEEEIRVLKTALDSSSSFFRSRLSFLYHNAKEREKLKRLFYESLEKAEERRGKYDKETIYAYQDVGEYLKDDDYLKIAYERAKIAFKEDKYAYKRVYIVLESLLKDSSEKKKDELIEDFFKYLIPIYKDDALDKLSILFENPLFGIGIKGKLLFDFLDIVDYKSDLYMKILIKILEVRAEGRDLLELSKDTLKLVQRKKGKESEEYYRVKIALSRIYKAEGRKSMALKCLNEGVLGIFSLSLPLNKYMDAIEDLINKLIRAKRYEEALIPALKYYEFSSSESDAMKIASIYEALEDNESALRYYLAAYDIEKKKGYDGMELLCTISSTYLKLEKAEEAKETAAKALDILNSLDDRYKYGLEPMIYYLLAISSFKLKDYEMCLLYGTRADELFSSLSSPNYVSERKELEASLKEALTQIRR